MLVVETIARIRRDHLVRGVPIKKIARDLRVSKNTVRKVVRGDETSYSYERKIQPMPKLGPWVGELERRLEANEKKPRRDRFSLLRIHEDLLALGYGGGYDAVRRYARTWRRRWRLLSPSQGFVPLSFDPGEAYQFDWSHEYARLSGVTTKVKAAHMRLCYARPLPPSVALPRALRPRPPAPVPAHTVTASRAARAPAPTRGTTGPRHYPRPASSRCQNPRPEPPCARR